MLFNSYSYEILYEQFHCIYLQGHIKLLPVTVNKRLKFEIEIVHDLSCHPIFSYRPMPVTDMYHLRTKALSLVERDFMLAACNDHMNLLSLICGDFHLFQAKLKMWNEQGSYELTMVYDSAYVLCVLIF